MHYLEVTNIEQAYLYILDCTLATVEDLALKKSRSRREYKRQKGIAQKSINWAMRFNVTIPAGERARDILDKYDGNVEEYADDIEVGTHSYYVSVADTALSGWGKAKGKTNVLIFRCQNEKEAEAVKEHAESRGDTCNVTVHKELPFFNTKDYLVQICSRRHYSNWYPPKKS